MSKELREAAEYVRANDGCKHRTYRPDHTFINHSKSLARAYLALLSSAPADDGDAVTEEWLREIGFTIVPWGHGTLAMAQQNVVFDPFYGEWSVVDATPKLKTRRQVRNLLSALGIEAPPKQEMEAKK